MCRRRTERPVAAQRILRDIPALEHVAADGFLPFLGLAAQTVDERLDGSKLVTVLERDLAERALEAGLRTSDSVRAQEGEEGSLDGHELLDFEWDAF